MAWLNLTMPNQTVKNGLKAKKIKLPQMNFVLEKQLIKFSCTYQPLSFCKSFKNILRANPELWGCAIFGPKMVQFPPNKIFFGKKLLISFSSTYWPLSLYKILKKFLKQIQSYQDMPFLGPKCHLPKREFFSENLLISLVPFIHAYLHAKNQS